MVHAFSAFITAHASADDEIGTGNTGGNVRKIGRGIRLKEIGGRLTAAKRGHENSTTKLRRPRLIYRGKFVERNRRVRFLIVRIWPFNEFSRSLKAFGARDSSAASILRGTAVSCIFYT